MKLYYAHYPSLENCLVRFVKEQRTNPLDKWLIVCASSFLTKQLQTRLVQELGAFANIHFITASGLITKLDQEKGGKTLPLFPQDHLRDFLIKELLAQPGLNRYPISAGFVQAVKSSLRDLADSLADPDILEEHLRSMPDFVLQEDNGRFAWLIALYRAYCQAESSIAGYRSYQTAFDRALEQLETSAYLHEFSHILIYGFYDMPGRQLELINRLRSIYPVTVFAPYSSHPAYQFAEKFFETNWLNAPGAENVDQPIQGAIGQSAQYLFANQGSAPAKQVQIVSVPDARGAVFFVVKEILRLQQRGHRPQDMAVIARNLSTYQDEIRRVFEENCLPLNASFNYPLSKYALGRFCMQLFTLARGGFAREKVLSIVTSPYFKQTQKAKWKRLIHSSLANRDLSQWRDLLPQSQVDSSELLSWLEAINQSLASLEEGQSWQKGVERALSLLREQVNEDAFQGKDGEIYQAVQKAISQILSYQSIRSLCKPGEFITEVTQALSSLTFNEVEHMGGGVTVTDALRARGLSFETVFLLGLNDAEFPLVVQEDPVLRDYYRFILRDTLGFWINGSLDRIDEEKLLFYSAVCSAKKHLYALVARYNCEGKPAVPSIYVAELARSCELNLLAPDALRVSGRLVDRLAHCKEELLSEKEISYQFILHPQSAQKNYQAAGLLTPEKEISLMAARFLASPGALGPFDGQIHSGPELFVRENARGFSPSALQELGACPMRYFLNRGLKLAEPDEPLSRQELSADRRGTMYHEVLKDFYELLLKQDLTHHLTSQVALEYLDRCLKRHYTFSSYKVFGIYPVIWEMILESIFKKLADFVTEDLKNLGTFTPTWFEREVNTPPQEDLPITLRGIMDRIDLELQKKQFCIVDYKSTRKGSSHLEKDFFAHLIFQPFLYTYMAKQMFELKDFQSVGACLLAISDYKRSDLDPAAYQSMYPKAIRFLNQLIDLIKTGTFFISPSVVCAYCPYTLLCRKDAFYSLVRANRSQASHALEEVRQ